MIGHRFVRFALVGAGAVGLNLLLFALLVGRLGVQYLWATAAIFFLVNAYGFVANSRWVFGVVDHPTRRLLRYYATMTVSLGLNLMSMALLVDGLKISYLVASAITSAWLAPILYLTHGRVAFVRHEPRAGKPRVLLVTHYYAEHGGGVEIVAGQLATHIADSFDVEWRAAGEGATPPGRVMRVGGIDRNPIRCWNGLEQHSGLPIPIPSPLAAIGLIRAARKADLVWVHDLIYPANLIAVMAAMTGRKPFVVTVHVGAIPYRNVVVRKLMALALGLAGRLFLTRAAAVVFVSERVRAEFLARWRLHDEQLIPNGVDLETFRPLTAAERTRLRSELGLGAGSAVLFVGRLVERKGLRLLHDLAVDMPAVEWLLAGRGPLDPEAWGLHNVRVWHDRSGHSLAQLYGAADLLALPSVGEGFPLVVAEALAMALPVLVDPSTIAGYSAVAEVAEGESVLGADAVHRWAVRITGILGDQAGRAATAPQRVEFARRHWSWSRAGVEYCEVLGRVLHDVTGDSGVAAAGADRATADRRQSASGARPGVRHGD